MRGATRPHIIAADDFSGQALDGAWGVGCGDPAPWTPANGTLTAPQNGTGRSCLLHGDSARADQWVRATFRVEAWQEPAPLAQLGLIGRHHTVAGGERFVLGALRAEPNANGVTKYLAVIEVYDPRLPDGHVRVGQSAYFDRLCDADERDDGFVEARCSAAIRVDEAGALRNGRGELAQLELELNGRTLRLSIGVGGERRILAAGLDAFAMVDGVYVYDHEELSEDPNTQLTGPGRAGLVVQGQPAIFDDFEVR